MKSLKLLLVTILIGVLGFGQTKITGKVTDRKGEPIMGANIFIVGTYDGASTDQNGEFSFTTYEENIQTLNFSNLGYEEINLKIDVSKMSGLKIIMRESATGLGVVELNTGSFKANDQAKSAVLKPLDIVTTAGAAGDYIAAFKTLPGTQQAGENGRLLVRGGEAYETQTFIDGLRVFKPYTTGSGSTPVRGRFSPFLFKGLTFSTGGFSAEYGQALSSVLLLNTIDMPVENSTNISVMTLGAGLAKNKIWNENTSLSVNTSYINLAGYEALFPDKLDWEKPAEVFSGEVVFRQKAENSFLKIYFGYSNTNMGLNVEDINYKLPINVDIKDKNIYTNINYKYILTGRSTVFTGISLSSNTNRTKQYTTYIKAKERSEHMKVKLKTNWSNTFKTIVGVERFNNKYSDYISSEYFEGNIELQKDNFAAFAENEVFLSKYFALKLGLRYNYSYRISDSELNTRLALAYKFSKKSQISMAYGVFDQDPKDEYIKYNNILSLERSEHFIFNYLYKKDKQMLRAELYYKKYDNLVKYDIENYMETNHNNKGYGYAKGVDLFWRDSKTFKYWDYWLSYSFTDTKRDYSYYENEALLPFVSKHNISLVGKRWFPKLRSQLGFSYSFATGRPYDNPNETSFMSGKTKNYNNMSLSWAYLITQQKILYISLDNVMGTDNVYGYNYKNNINKDGIYTRKAILPTADRFVFVGFFWTISDNKNSNQLDNL
ncbi:MAG: TonB-dependent receptor [Flavobacteriaceae bacterium]|nr:TonB-dependent receptor [Flavobacteriaceae bacterium]